MTEKTKNYSAPIITGILIIAFFIAFQYFSPIKGDAGRLIQGTLSIILRVVAGFWIFSIAKEQGRKSLPFVLRKLSPKYTLIWFARSPIIVFEVK